MSVLLLVLLVVGVVARARARTERGLHRADRAVRRQIVVTLVIGAGVVLLAALIAAFG